jgi:hypothetical protein
MMRLMMMLIVSGTWGISKVVISIIRTSCVSGANSYQLHCRRRRAEKDISRIWDNLGLRDNNGDNDNSNKDYDTEDEAQPHFHVLPPHLLSYSVCTPPEALCRVRQVICFILELVQVLSSFRGLVDVVSHDTDGVINLGLDLSCPALAIPALSIIARDVWIVGLFGHFVKL